MSGLSSTVTRAPARVPLLRPVCSAAGQVLGPSSRPALGDQWWTLSSFRRAWGATLAAARITRPPSAKCRGDTTPPHLRGPQPHMSHPLTVPKCRAGNRNSERLSNLGTATQGAEGLWWEPGLPMLLLGGRWDGPEQGQPRELGGGGWWAGPGERLGLSQSPPGPLRTHPAPLGDTLTAPKPQAPECSSRERP